MIFCTSVNVQGHFRRGYSADWTNKLHRALARRLPNAQHVVFTDHPFKGFNLEIRPVNICEWWNEYRHYGDGLYNPIGGWWSKIKLFDPEVWRAFATHDDTVLYFDVDTLITGPVDDLLSFPHYLRILKDSAINQRARPGVIRRYNSSVMSWRVGEFASLYREFGRDVLDTWRSDQDWIAARVDPERIVTYDEAYTQRLSACIDSGPAPGTRVVLCIKPKNDIAAKKADWVNKLWR